MLRSLIHHWRVNLAVALGAAVATAVLAGAVIVGDSLESSLRRLTLDRVGAIDWALIAQQPFREALADDLDAALALPGASIAPVMLSSASAVHTDSRALAAGVELLGIDERFTALFPDSAAALDLERAEGQIFPSAAINASLAGELDARLGDDVLLSFQQLNDIPRESLLGSRPAEGEITGLRVTIRSILPDRGLGRFAITSHQQQPLNAFVELDVLQSRLDRRERANALFVDLPLGNSEAPIEAAVARAVTFDDLGLEIERSAGTLSLSNRRFVLRESTARTLEAAAAEAGWPHQPVLGYLANGMRRGERSLPYSMVLGLDLPAPAALGHLVSIDGEPIGPLDEGRIVLGEWAAADLGAAPGDTIELTYFGVGRNDELETRRVELEVAEIAAMDGLMTDASVLPEFPGIADADDIAAWEPPFPMDLTRIRPRDEEFWDLYRAAPKAIVPLDTAQALWSNRFGRLTTVRLAAPASEQEAWLADLRRDLDLASFGLALEPIREEGLRASSGATDFAGLFLAFSLFLIVAAALVVGLLFSLSVEMRAREVGLRRALGFPLGTIRRELLAEGLALAGVGALLGIGLAIAYAALLIGFIQTLWADMLDLPLLELDLCPGNLAGAALGSVLLVIAAVLLALRRLRRLTIPGLLAGDVGGPRRGRSGRRARAVAWVALVAGALCAVVAVVSGSGSSPALFFLAGTAFLTAGLAGFASWLRRARGELDGSAGGAWAVMAARNSGFNPGRSLLSVALVACATFMLVSVAANRRVLRPESLGRDSGTGGFSLVAQSDVAIHSWSSEDAAAELGLSEPSAAALASSFALRFRPGDDASCLNLYQPETPRLVGVTDAFVERGGFEFTATLQPADNPWTLLDLDLGDGVVPAIGDANSVMWILHSGLGKEIEITDDRGERLRLRLVGLLGKSIFQSELLISEEAFLRHFPDHGGFSYFLLDTSAETAGATAAALEGDLAGYGFDATSTVDKLARFLGIEEMYLSTFQLLGGLGLALGTAGLGIVLLRNVNERRRELAMLRAVGFRRRSISALILLETAFQLLCGLLVGGVSGGLALLPYVLDASLHLPWGSLALTLGAVVVIGMSSASLAVVAALRAPLLAALKAD